MFGHFDDADRALYDMLPHVSLARDIDFAALEKDKSVKSYEVYMPNEEYAFLHESAIIAYKGVLYASWYNCPSKELHGRTPIRGRRSYDGGVTWSEVETIADDPTGRILWCPPVYGIDNGRLYMLINEMVAPDHMHALDLFVLNEETDRFEMLWSRPIPHKLNTNVVTLPNGRLMLPGRIAELDGFPNTPSVLISDSGHIDAEWRLVKIAENGILPDGSSLVHPELSCILDGERVIMFCRDDNRRVPLLYLSEDCGETWSGPCSCDIPFSNSKIYAGNLSNGGSYVIGSLYPGRSKLTIFFSETTKPEFTRGVILQNGYSAELGYGTAWHYPCAYEYDGKLYVIYTVQHETKGRGAALSVIPLN
ncbi:MAG: exo-alpha-sialidase [Clostridiales bacterium]|nr:exo-alpha-sialidase [Clostridiales bacterium]